MGWDDGCMWPLAVPGPVSTWPDVKWIKSQGIEREMKPQACF